MQSREGESFDVFPEELVFKIHTRKDLFPSETIMTPGVFSIVSSPPLPHIAAARRRTSIPSAMGSIPCIDLGVSARGDRYMVELVSPCVL